MHLRIATHPRKEVGFGLVEVMIAVILATFGLLAVGQLLCTAISSASLSRLKTTAALVARNRLESLADLYDRDPLHEDLVPGVHGPHELEVMNPMDETVLHRYCITWSAEKVRDPRPDKIPNATLVKVTVSPHGNVGDPNRRPRYNRTVTLSAVLSPKTR